ncbi:hypothetical protein H2198_005908 [Neophaeococcomyces mojaviensis]|uniref:Uncharacterized protein n=1 Tax=Neophaeococcomyces mojaviensis TaxID=3383035 RepID=A0ACC3A501_9EURO|nr:hypothetical protein H2198_005908 [Knufia sp. JES_112]
MSNPSQNLNQNRGQKRPHPPKDHYPHFSINPMNTTSQPNSAQQTASDPTDVRSYQGHIWDEIFDAVESANTRRHDEAQRGLNAHTQNLASFSRTIERGPQNPFQQVKSHSSVPQNVQQSVQQTFQRAEQVESTCRFASLRNLPGNDELTRDLRDIPDYIEAGQFMRAHGITLFGSSSQSESNGEESKGMETGNEKNNEK